MFKKLQKSGVLYKKQHFKLLLTFFSVLLCINSVSALWYTDSETVTVDLSISSGLDVIYSGDAILKSVTANVSFVPRESQTQSIIRISSVPESNYQDTHFSFYWSETSQNNLDYSINVRVKTSNSFMDISRIEFPYLGFSDSVAEYTRPGKIINSDDVLVAKKASELALGETDYYAVVFKMAEWTKKNIHYDLSTLNIKASNKASEVIRSRSGVCDEITTLFIALLRSVGIPARFVTGVAYTESTDFPKNWGAHGWAEVFFPGVGWVPFDVTYGQFGFIDPTHIKMKDSVDAGESDTSYAWYSRGVDIKTKPISIDVDLVASQGNINDRVLLNAGVLQSVVGIGSYNILVAKVKNLRNSYVSTTLYPSRTDGLEFMTEREKPIMLKPLEEKNFYWILKLSDNLDAGFTYTFPVLIADTHSSSSETSFEVLPRATVFSKSQMDLVVSAAKKDEKSIFSKKVRINCSQEKLVYYEYEKPVVVCTVKNIGNVGFTGLKFCFEDDCEQGDLLISKEKTFSKTIDSPKTGINKIGFSVSGKDISKSSFYDLDIFDRPSIGVRDIEYPSQLEYDLPFEIRFKIDKVSFSIPKSAVLNVGFEGRDKKEIELGEFEAGRNLVFNLNSRDLSTKPNRFIISLVWEDDNGISYTEKESFEIDLINVTFGQRLVILLHDIDRKLRGFIS